MAYEILNFGKHEGKTLPQVIFKDLDWFIWATENDVFKGKSKQEATVLFMKIQNIKILKDNPDDYVVEYTLHPSTDSMCMLEILEKTTPKHVGSSQTFRKDRIDLTLVRNIKNYDKLGSKLIIGNLKYYFFNDSKCRMTKKKCEDFFNNEDNFIK